MRVSLFLLALGLAPDSSTTAGAQVCPASEMQFRDMGVFASETAAFDSTHTVFPDFQVAYDLLEGTLFVYHGGSLGVTFVEAGDAYDVTGFAPGTPVWLVVELLVDGEVWDMGGCGGGGCSGTLGMRIEHGVDIEERRFSPTLFDGARSEFHTVLQLPVRIVAGQPEEIRFRLWGTRMPGGSHGATGTGRIRFTGLTPGSSIVSCHGFDGEVTRARNATWGEIKAQYR